jgi:hypothetical protein
LIVTGTVNDACGCGEIDVVEIAQHPPSMAGSASTTSPAQDRP